MTTSERTRSDLPTWLGWTLVSVIALALLASWIPASGLPLGDSHEGRILARFGLHVRNFWELGALESGLATDLSPYPAASNYAHHPPLINAAHVAVSGLLGQGATQLRLVGYSAGIGTIFMGAALLRTLRIRWIPALLALAALAATPMFWIYGRLGGGFSLVLGLAAAMVALREQRDPPGWLVAVAAALGLATAMLSWPAALTAAILGLWLWRRRGFDGPVIVVGSAMVLGAVLTAGWILQATTLEEVLGQAESRTTDLGFTVGEWLGRQWRWLSALLPAWYLILLVPGLVAGFWREQTRFLTALTLGITVVWAVALPSGSFIHDFWNLSLLASGLLGMAALFDWLAGPLSDRTVVMAGAAAGVLLAISFGTLLTGPWYEAYFIAPSEAGALLEAASPGEQPQVWVVEGISTARWASWYWDRPIARLQPDNISEPGRDDLVMVRLDRLPPWIPDAVSDWAVDIEGRYALIYAGDLRDLTAP